MIFKRYFKQILKVVLQELSKIATSPKIKKLTFKGK